MHCTRTRTTIYFVRKCAKDYFTLKFSTIFTVGCVCVCVGIVFECLSSRSAMQKFGRRSKKYFQDKSPHRTHSQWRNSFSFFQLMKVTTMDKNEQKLIKLNCKISYVDSFNFMGMLKMGFRRRYCWNKRNQLNSFKKNENCKKIYQIIQI